MQKNKNIIGIVAVVVFIVGASAFAMKNYSSSTQKTETKVETSTTTTGTTATTGENTGTTTAGATMGVSTGPKSYTLADVAAHAKPSSCWTTINGNVYDVSSWIGQHPGGSEAIISLCGIDGSAAFNGQHGGQPRPASELASFKIGVLK